MKLCSACRQYYTTENLCIPCKRKRKLELKRKQQEDERRTKIQEARRKLIIQYELKRRPLSKWKGDDEFVHKARAVTVFKLNLAKKELIPNLTVSDYYAKISTETTELSKND